MRKKKNILGIAFIAIIITTIVAIGVCSILLFRDFKSLSNNNTKVDYTNVLYKEPINNTSYGSALFRELCSDVEKYIASGQGEEETSKLIESVAKNFICDYFTWSNKKGAYDVGGLFFVNEKQAINVSEYAKINYYKNFVCYEKDELPEVDNVVVDNVDEENHIVYLTWEYKSGNPDSSYFPTTGTIKYSFNELILPDEFNTVVNRIEIISLEVR